MFANAKTSWGNYWTSERFTLKHLGLALALVLGVYVLYTVFRGSLPSPDVLSPFAYLIAFIASLFSYLRLEDRKNSGFSLFVLVLCGLAFMDEISYGVELGFVNPIYVEKYNVYIYDLHNLIGLVIELIQIFLRENNWNAKLFNYFLQIDLIAISIGLFYIIVVRAKRNGKGLDGRILLQLALFLLGVGVISALGLALLPADPKNAWLFIYSRSRVGTMSGILLISSLPIAWITYFRRWGKGKDLNVLRPPKFFSSKSFLQRLRLLALGIIFLGLTYEFGTPFITYPDQKVIIDRVTPVVAWAIFSSVLIISAVQAWSGKLTRPMKSYIDPVRSFIRSNPPLIYALTAVLIISIAQVNDKGWVLLGEYFSIPNVGITDWGWWTEEVFEFTAAIEFFAASFFYKKTV